MLECACWGWKGILVTGFPMSGFHRSMNRKGKLGCLGCSRIQKPGLVMVLVNLVTEAATFDIELFDGETGLGAGIVRILLCIHGVPRQLDSLLATYAPGVTTGFCSSRCDTSRTVCRSCDYPRRRPCQRTKRRRKRRLQHTLRGLRKIAINFLSRIGRNAREPLESRTVQEVIAARKESLSKSI